MPRFKESMVNQNGHFSLWRRSSPLVAQVRDEGIHGPITLDENEASMPLLNR